MTGTRTGPIPDSYWLLDGQLLAGEYPATPDPSTTREKLAKFLDAGIRTFVDLTEPSDPLSRYDEALREVATARGVDARHVRLGIRDLGVPRDHSLTRTVLATI